MPQKKDRQRRVIGRITTEPTSWARDDAKWFERRAHRSHRVRPRFPDEWFAEPADAPDLDLVAVRQIVPGVRIRTPFTLPPSPSRERLREAAMTEVAAHALFDLSFQRSRERSCAEVEAWIAHYAQGGAG
jgi:hypothetical protein